MIFMIMDIPIQLPSIQEYLNHLNPIVPSRIIPKLDTNKTSTFDSEREQHALWIKKTTTVEMKNTTWNKEEDALLVQSATAYKEKQWRSIAQDIPNRSAKQCRDRWHTKLRKDIVQSKWTQVERNTLWKLHLQFGNKWSKIAKHLPGRTPSAVKNQFRSFKVKYR